MKVKLAIDKTAIRDFFFDHVEKIVFGAVLLGVAAIVDGAVVGGEKIDKEPRQLAAKADEAKNKIEQPRVLDIKATDVDKIAATSREPVAECLYVPSKPWTPSLRGSEQPRGVPPVLAVEGLCVAAEMGVFQVLTEEQKKAAAEREREPKKATPGGGDDQPEGNLLGGGGMPGNSMGNDLRGYRWAVLTGLVPVQKQNRAYVDAFRDSKHMDNDFPLDVGYLVERIEVTSPAEAKNPDWTDKKKVVEFNSGVKMSDAAKDWQSQQQEVVESKYIDPRLTFPLGPWLDGTWSRNVAHEPEIPFLSPDAMAAAGAAVASEETKPAEEGDAFDDRTPELMPGRGGMAMGPGGGPRGEPMVPAPSPGRGMGGLMGGPLVLSMAPISTTPSIIASSASSIFRSSRANATSIASSSF